MSIVFIGIILIIIVVVIILAKSAVHFGQIISWEKSKRIGGVYGIVMLAVVVAFYCMPFNGVVKTQSPTIGHGEDLVDADADIFKAFEEKKLDNTSGIEQLQKWSFDCSSEQMEIVCNGSPEYIMGEKNTTQNGKIEVGYYSTKYYCNQVDITRFINLPKVAFANGQLIITKPKIHNICYAYFDKDFTTAQFMGQSFINGLNNEAKYGVSVLYIKMPQNVQLKETNVSVHFRGE